MRAKVKMPTDAEEAAIQQGIAADPDTVELTDAQMAKMRPAAEVMPPELYSELVRRRRGRGVKPAKVLLSLRVEPDVVAGLRATGPGWQRRAGEALAKLVTGKRR